MAPLIPFERGGVSVGIPRREESASGSEKRADILFFEGDLRRGDGGDGAAGVSREGSMYGDAVGLERAA